MDLVTRKLCLVLLMVGVLCPIRGQAQSDATELSLGDLARSLRKGKPAPQHAVIDNENLQQVMDEVQNRKLDGSLLFTFDSAARKFQVSSPDVTCDLSFSAAGPSLLADSYVPQDLPESELVKLDGPALISGDTLQVSVHNGTAWNIKEITVGLTILRGSEAIGSSSGSAKLVPATQTTTLLAEKHPDQTVLYHLKGSAAPSVTAVFHETLGTALRPNQEWHWAIVQAKGLPPQPSTDKLRTGN
jgi:hypothetical protein